MEWDFITDPNTGELTIGEAGTDPNKLQLSNDLTDTPIVNKPVEENKPVTQTQASPEVVALQQQIAQLTQGMNTITQFLTGQISNQPKETPQEFTMEDEVANSLFPDNAEHGKKFMKSVVDNVGKIVDDKLKELKSITAPITVQHTVEQEFQASASKYGKDFVSYIPVMQHILTIFPNLNMTSEDAYLKAKQLYPNYKPQQQNLQTQTKERDLPDRLNSNAGEDLHPQQVKTLDDAMKISMQELGMIS